MPGAAFVRGETVGLYTVERDDLGAVREWWADPGFRYGSLDAGPRNDDQAEEWFEEHVSDTGEGAQFLVCPLAGTSDDGAAGDAPAAGDRTDADSDDGPDDAGPRPVGFVSLHDVEQPAAHGELSCLVAPERGSEGYATAATRLLVTYALDELRLHKVATGVVASDEAARAVLEDLGFVREETRREERYVDGAHRDVVRYSVLAPEWDGERGPGGRAEEV